VKVLIATLIVGGTAMAAVAVTSTGYTVQTAHASGGGCVAVSGPVCTFTGHAAIGSFQNASGCAVEDVFVFASEQVTRSGPGGTTTGAEVFVSTSGYNSCTQTSYYGYSQAFTGTVQTSPALTADGTAYVLNYQSDGTTSTQTFTLHLTWKGIGSVSRSVDSFHYQAPGLVSQGHFTGTDQAAIVSGSISDGTTSFAPSSLGIGEMILADSGTFVLIQ
jgi:hypothetical protein